MNYNLAPFQEPRGVMRVLQLVFGICAFLTTLNFTVTLVMDCQDRNGADNFEIEYPFRFYESNICRNANNGSVSLTADVSSDAQFFVATGVLSMLYCFFIIIVYAYLDELYQAKPEIPMADFILTTILAIFWLSGSAAWSNGSGALKSVLDTDAIWTKCHKCTVQHGGFSGVNTSLLLGFLNFFLWASNLWFVYKETIWFQGRQPQQQTQMA